MVQAVHSSFGGPQTNPFTGGEAERFNGAQERGYAFGKRRGEAAAETGSAEGSQQTQSQTAQTQTTQTQTAQPSVGQVSQTQTTHVQTSQTQTSQSSATNALYVSQDSTKAVTITLSDAAVSKSKGVTQIEDGGSYVLTPDNHPGAKYAVLGAGGDGITNPNNIKGYFVLNQPLQATVQNDAGKGSAGKGSAGKKAATPEPQTGPLLDKVSEFLARRGEIASKANEASDKAPKSSKIDRNTLEAAGLLQAPEGDILNIRDNRFDTNKFTGRQAVSLEIAAGFAVQKQAQADTTAATDEQRPGKRLGQLNGHGGKGQTGDVPGNAYGHDKLQTVRNNGEVVSSQVLQLLRGGYYA